MQCTDCSANARDVLAVVVTRWCNVDTRACIDLDGTLVDSLPDLRAGLNEMLRGLTRRELSADEVRRMTFRKPDVRHLLTALEQLRASPNESVMIGDNENDYVAARAAGVAVILMRYGYLRVPLETLAPDAWLDRFADIPPALHRIKK